MNESGVVYFNLNEEGQPYERHRTLRAAVRTLERHPEDWVVMALRGSHYARKLGEELDAERRRDRELREATR